MAEAPHNVVLVAKALARLGLSDAVFVGGATIPLRVTDAGAVPPRVTYDVDVVVDLRTRMEFYRLEKRLREAGYSQPVGGPICRWTIDDVPVDLMPVDIGVLGFTNRWYGDLVRTAQSIRIAPGLTIRVADPGMLLVTKLEAYQDRGGGDFALSHDITDVVTLLEGRPEIVAEVRRLGIDAKAFVRQVLSSLVSDEDFRFAIHGHLPPDAHSQERAEVVQQRLRALLNE